MEIVLPGLKRITDFSSSLKALIVKEEEGAGCSFMALHEGFNALLFLLVISLPGLTSSFARSRQALRGRSEAPQEVISQAGEKWALPSKQSDK